MIRSALSIYLTTAFCIACIVTLTKAMGVIDAPLGRVWAFVWIPWLAAVVINVLNDVAKRMDQ